FVGPHLLQGDEGPQRTAGSEPTVSGERSRQTIQSPINRSDMRVLDLKLGPQEKPPCRSSMLLVQPRGTRERRTSARLHQQQRASAWWFLLWPQLQVEDTHIGPVDR